MAILRCVVHQTQIFNVEVPLSEEEVALAKTPKGRLQLVNQDVASWDFQDCVDEIWGDNIEEGTWEVSDE